MPRKHKNFAATDWDFYGIDTRRWTHGIHSYPAKMIPPLAARLLDEYGAGITGVFDPYCGTGTSLLEANARGLSALGSDLNPLARLIAQVKTTPIPVRPIITAQQKILRTAARSSPWRPEYPKLDYWFSRPVQKKLAGLKTEIMKIPPGALQRFFLVAFSATVRQCSYTRPGQFKLHRRPAAAIIDFAPAVLTIFGQHVERNLTALQRYQQEVPHPGKSRVAAVDTVITPVPKYKNFPIDLVLTSPPYGDSVTTVAYGQFSRLAHEWLGVPAAQTIDRRLMGGQRCSQLSAVGCDAVDAALNQINQTHPARARELCAFYHDYRKSIAHVGAALRPGGIACYVVGNRVSKNVLLPTHLATQDYFIEGGFQPRAVHCRNIPNKRMPARNSPSNIAGAGAPTINHEYIVIMQKN